MTAYLAKIRCKTCRWTLITKFERSSMERKVEHQDALIVTPFCCLSSQHLLIHSLRFQSCYLYSRSSSFWDKHSNKKTLVSMSGNTERERTLEGMSWSRFEARWKQEVIWRRDSTGSVNSRKLRERGGSSFPVIGTAMRAYCFVAFIFVQSLMLNYYPKKKRSY